jgi:hypothetical protein
MSCRLTSPFGSPIALPSNLRQPWSADPQPPLVAPTDAVQGTPS